MKRIPGVLPDIADQMRTELQDDRATQRLIDWLLVALMFAIAGFAHVGGTRGAMALLGL